MGTKIHKNQDYIGYIKCGEILKSPLQNYQNPFVLKCFQCAEIHFLLESFIIHIQEHCKDVVSSIERNETKTLNVYSNQEQVDSEGAGVENQTIKLETDNAMEMEDPLIVVKNEIDVESSTVKEEYELQETEIPNKNFDIEYQDNFDDALVDSTDEFQPDDTETDEDENINIRTFRERVANGLLDHSSPQPLKTGKHIITKRVDGNNKTIRRACVLCYAKAKKESSRKTARNHLKRTSTYCPQCPNTPQLCLQCFPKYVHLKK